MPDWKDIEDILDNLLSPDVIAGTGRAPRVEDLTSTARLLLSKLEPADWEEWAGEAIVIDAQHRIQTYRTLAEAEAALRAHGVPRPAEIPEESPVARSIADALHQIDVQRLGPYGVLVLLFWLIFFHMNMDQIAGAALFYMVLSDYFKKKD